MKHEKKKSGGRTSSKYLIKKSKPSLISNMKIHLKMAAVFVVMVLLSGIVLFIMAEILSKEEEKRKNDTEETVIMAAEQYISASVDYIVNVAKAVYTNATLYQLLDKEYKSSSEYYEAFHSLQSNNSMIVSESKYIKNYAIYTDNSTILEGGNIFSLSKVTNEEWYAEFSRLNKAIIIYCDKYTHELSLIRTMDYYPLNNGKCILKINLAANVFQEYFSNLNFEGRLYVMYSGTPVFSNVKSSDSGYGVIDTDYTCIISNYYSSEFEYYACADKSTFLELMKKNYGYGIFYLVFLLFSVIIAFIVIRNIAVRIRRLKKYMDADEVPYEIYKRSPGKDEIGDLYSCFLRLNDKYEHMKKEIASKENEIEMLNKSSTDLRSVAVELDCINTAIRKYPLLDDKKSGIFKDFVPLNAELDKIRMMSELITEAHLDVKVSGELPDTFVVPPAIIPLITADLASYNKEDRGNGRKLLLTAEAAEDNVRLILTFSGNYSISSSRTLKLRAVFEDETDNFADEFIKGYNYNPYIRLKSVMKNRASADISGDADYFRMIITIDYEQEENT